MSDKRRARQGAIAGNLTPAEAKVKLALPVLALLRGDAVPVFPGTSLAGPSGKVGIFRKPGSNCRGLPSQKVLTLPVWLNDRQWERAVLPVLQSSQWNSAGFQSLFNLNGAEAVRQLGEALALSFHQAGYGPLPEEG